MLVRCFGSSRPAAEEEVAGTQPHEQGDQDEEGNFYLLHGIISLDLKCCK